MFYCVSGFDFLKPKIYLCKSLKRLLTILILSLLSIQTWLHTAACLLDSMHQQIRIEALGMDDGDSQTPHAEIPEKNLMPAEEAEGWHRVASLLSMPFPEDPAGQPIAAGYPQGMAAPLAEILTPPPQS